MLHFICTACGMQYAESDKPPAQCVVCEEERQYVPPRGQTWTTLAAHGAKPYERVARVRQRHYRHRLDAAIRHRPARAAVAHRGRQHFVGLRRHARRRDHDGDQGPRRAARQSPSRIRISTPRWWSGRRPSSVRSISTPPTKPGSCDPIRRSNCGRAIRSSCGMASRWFAAAAISKAARCCIGRKARRPRCGLFRRYSHRRHRPQVAVLHAQLSEFHSAVGARGYAHRRSDGSRFPSTCSTATTSTASLPNDAKSVLEKSVARYIAAVEGKRRY